MKPWSTGARAGDVAFPARRPPAFGPVLPHGLQCSAPAVGGKKELAVLEATKVQTPFQLLGPPRFVIPRVLGGLEHDEDTARRVFFIHASPDPHLVWPRAYRRCLKVWEEI